MSEPCVCLWPDCCCLCVQSRLEYMVQRDGGADASTSQPSQALAPTNMLFMDEQYVVSLFQVQSAMGLSCSRCRDVHGKPVP